MKYGRNIIGESDPINALDYPASLDDSKWVLWASSGKWPDADRRLAYLGKKQKDAMRGFYLLTMFQRDAQRFDTEAEARAFLAEQDALRTQPWQLNCTTVAALKLHCGYYVEVN
jgi:hypothetical protein